MSAAEMMREAARWIREHPDRWGQGQFAHVDGVFLSGSELVPPDACYVCAMGAMALVRGISPEEVEVMLHVECDDVVDSSMVVSYNDEEGRTPVQVATWLEAMADECS